MITVQKVLKMALLLCVWKTDGHLHAPLKVTLLLCVWETGGQLHAPLKMTCVVCVGNGWSLVCSAKVDLTLYRAERVRDG